MGFRNRSSSYKIHHDEGEEEGATGWCVCCKLCKTCDESEDPRGNVTQRSVIVSQPQNVSAMNAQSPVRADDRNQGTSKETGSEFNRLQYELVALKEKVTRLEDEKQTLLSRLSEAMGRKLEEGNPNITNLNDPNRPQKVGEMFVSIYDNEWTDAFSLLEDSGIESRKVIDILLNILKMSFDGCQCHIEEFSNHIKRGFPGYDVSLDSRLIDCVTSLSHTTISYLTEKTTKEVVTEYSQEVKDKSHAYIARCVRLCFFMLTKTPPMFLCFECTVIDKQAFKVFTKDGSSVDYIVWPTLYLYKDGPLMEKGVVQYK